ncbi:MAG: AAA family ATPase, partial [Candidatus Natronoplasma sp.]
MNNAEDALDVASEVMFDIMDGEKAKLRFENLPDARRKSISNLREADRNKLLKIPAIVRNVGDKEGKLKKAVYVCKSCGTRFKEVENPEKPLECQGCGKSNNKTRFVLDEDRSEYEDIQKIKVQEPTENLEGGKQPDSIIAVLKDDLVGEVHGGERVDLNAILKMKKKSRSSNFKKYLKINNIEMKEKPFQAIDLTEEDRKEIEELKEEGNVLDKIHRSIAPDVFGLEKEKMAIALQLFRGVRKKINRSNRRGDIHILLIGDPGTAKTVLIKSVADLAPKSMFKSGKGASGAGLTATAVRDEEMGGWVIKAGVLPLCDGGLACIDEIDKMSDEDREYMNDAMGSAQIIPIAKGGEEVELQSRTSVLAAGNPKYGRFDSHEEVTNQIDLDPTLISRFDYIFPLYDQPSKFPDHDDKTTDHMAEMHMKTKDEDIAPIDDDLLRKYIAHARQIRPEFKENSMEKLTDFFKDMRKASDEAMSITRRQFDTLVRTSEASARMRLSEKVEREDVDRAIELFLYFIDKVAKDSSGNID